MNEANENSSIRVPASVARAAWTVGQSLAADGYPIKHEQWAILRRLVTDARMLRVWKELTRLKRQGGGYFHPAKLRSDKPVFKRRLEEPALTQDEVQAEALAELFHFAYCAARDRITVSKASEVEEMKAKLLQRAQTLRDIADDLIAANPADPLDAVDALRRVAAWLEAGAASLRPPDDPLTIQNERGDRVVRGVQIVIAAHLREAFGKPLDGTAATLAAVALGQETSERVTRSAFSGRKKR
jgi:hypothetical protein